MRIPILITLLLLLSCSNSDKPNSNIVKVSDVKIDTSLTAEQNSQKFDSIYKLSNSISDYINPKTKNCDIFFKPARLIISDVNNVNSEKTIINEISSICWGVTDDSREENVLVIKSQNDVKSIYITQINEPNEGKMINQQILKGHRRISIYNGNGYKEEMYVVLIQTNNNKVVSLQILKDNTNALMTYLTK